MIIILKIMIFVLNIIYFFLKLLPTKKQIVFMSRQSINKNLDFKLLGKELEKKYKVIYLCKPLKGKEKAKILDMINYGFHMLKQMYYLSTSKLCIIDSYIPTISILRHKKDLIIIQMWHSIGTMKKFGYTTLDKKSCKYQKIAHTMKMHKNYDIVFASSKNYKSHLAAGFNISQDKILIYTLPRVDLLQDKKYEEKTKRKIYEIYPELQKKKNIVYAPTFRDDEENLYKHIIELIKELNFKKYNLIIKLHPLSKINIENKDVIVDKKFSTFDMLFVADMLISDYSCIIYEAGIRDIPLFFYDFDVEYYLDTNGLALDYNELPGYKEKSARALVKSLEKKYDFSKLKKFIDKYVDNTDDCTLKIAKKIEKLMK